MPRSQPGFKDLRFCGLSAINTKNIPYQLLCSPCTLTYKNRVRVTRWYFSRPIG